MIVTKPPRRRAPAFVLAQSSRSAAPAQSMPSAPVRPSGAARPFTVRVVPPPPPGAALYARGANGRSEELTGRGVIAPEGDALLVTVPAWTLRLTALVAGQVVADVVLARPSGAVGDAVTLELTEATGLSAVLQGASNITRMPTPDGAPARWGDPAAGYPITSYFLGATEGGEALTVRATGRPARMFALGPVAGGRARIDLALRAVRWRRVPEGATIRLTDRDGTNITTNPLPNGAPAGWDGADWISGVPVATRAVTIEKPDGTTQAVALPAIPEGERELAVDVAPRELAILAPVVPLPPARERTFVSPGMVLYDVGGGGGGGGDAPPGMVTVRLRGTTRAANGAPNVTVLVDGNDGTRASLPDGTPPRWDGNDWRFGLASTIRTVRVRYPDGAERDLAVPVTAAGAEVVLEVPAPPAPLPVGVRMRNAVPGSRFFVGATDVTLVLPTPDGMPPRWDGNDWLIGVPAGTRAVRVRYPSGAERDLALPEARAGESVTVDASAPAPAAPATPPAFLTLRVRGAGSGADGIPTLLVFDGDADITTAQLPDGRPAQWDGNAWLLGFPRTLRAVRVRYPSGAVGTFDLPLPTDASTEALIEVPQDVQQTNTDGDGPLEVAPTSTLAFVRVWLIDPPRGTRLFRYPVVPADYHPAIVPQELTGYGTDLAGSVALPGSGRASVPVYEYRLPDTADGTVRTSAVHAELPDGTRVDVPLSPVPSDGILRVDLSRRPGTRAATVHGADGGGVGLGTVAVVAAGLAGAGWLALRGRARGRRAGVDARDNPSRPRKARRRGRR